MSRRKAAKGRRRHYTVVVPVQHMITLADCSVCSQKATGPCESYFLPIQYKTEIPNEYLHLLTHYWKTAFLVLQAQYWSLRSTTLGHTPYPALCSSPHDSKHNAHTSDSVPQLPDCSVCFATARSNRNSGNQLWCVKTERPHYCPPDCR